MGLCYQTSRWLDHLWAAHLDMSSPARDLVEAGIEKQGEPFAGFPADLHARLYLPRDPQEIDEGPEWAARLHSLATELGEWQRLRKMCARNGFAAGVATEAMLNQLLPHVPERPHESSQNDSPDPQENECSGEKSSSHPSETPQKHTLDRADADLRASLRRAACQARNAVQQAEAEMEGLGTPLGLSPSGNSSVLDGGPANLKAIRDAHTRLAGSRRLRRISELAGRLERVAASKARSKVKPGIGEVHGIGLSGDLSRLLPSEIVTLRHPRLRLLTMSRVLQRKALSYSMIGREPQARGPIILLLDESASMRENARDVWSKAVCLALLSTATRQRRTWHLVAFNGAIKREVAVPARQATAQLVQDALDHSCNGGTDFNAPVRRAVDIIKNSRTMRQADVVIITDGEDTLTPDTIQAATALTKTEGVSWYVVGVGPNASTCAETLGPIATSIVHVKNTDDTEVVVSVINLEAA